MAYERLTPKDWATRYQIGVCSRDISAGECEVYNDGFKYLQRLAELEDKLESGQLVESLYIGQPLYLVGYLGTSPVMEECKITDSYIYHKHTYVDIVGSVGQPLDRNYDLTENAHGYIFSKEEAEQRLAEL